MAIQNIPVDQIKDNPYNPRSHYDADRTKELASSIKQNGLLEIPKARKVDENTYELAYGGYRLRAFKILAKEAPENWAPVLQPYVAVTDGKLGMPLDVIEISDVSLAIFALEENLKRHNLTPMDTANAIAKYFDVFPNTREEEFAARLSMSQGAISNMRRVTKLPKEVLKYIDDETINFTMGRELCVLIDVAAITKGAVDPKLLMIDAITLIGTDGYAATVAGIKKAIHKVVHNTFRPLGPSDFGVSPEFDTIACQKCDKSIKTTGEDGKAAYHCLDAECWNLQQSTAQRKKQEAEEAQAEERKRNLIPIPEGVRLASDVPREECATCELTVTDHTIKFKFPNENGAYRRVCVKDYLKITGESVDSLRPNATNISQGIKTEPAVEKPEPRIINVDPKRLAKKGDIYESYSAPQIVNSQEIKEPFHELGEDYISVGEYNEIDGAKRTYRLILRGDYNKEIRSLKTPAGMNQTEYRAQLQKDPFGPYNGVIVNWNGTEHVMVGPEVVFAPAKEMVTPVPATVTPPGAFDKATEIPVKTDEQEPEEGDEEESDEEEGEVEEATGSEELKTPAPVKNAPATTAPEDESADTLYTVFCKLSVIIPGGIGKSEEERRREAWIKFKNFVIADEYAETDIQIIKESRK